MRDCVRFNPGMRAAVCVAVWMGASTSLAQSHPETPASEVDDFLVEYAGSCAGPEGVTDCAAGSFETTFARRLVWIGDHREGLTERWREQVRGGSHVPAYGLAFLRDTGALPALRAQLLADRYFYGWETDHPDRLAVRMRDEQYPHHMAVLGAIEALAGVPAAQWVAATPAECASLAKEVKAGPEGPAVDAARWLSQKLCHR